MIEVTAKQLHDVYRQLECVSVSNFSQGYTIVPIYISGIEGDLNFKLDATFEWKPTEELTIEP